ncbi:hypothetical protein C8Q79DRAFT_336623 [Trametes meyenii]|nr:hypothetical protein C8Q79DRAFT_336623 [Trametes meyenii]
MASIPLTRPDYNTGRHRSPTDPKREVEWRWFDTNFHAGYQPAPSTYAVISKLKSPSQNGETAIPGNAQTNAPLRLPPPSSQIHGSRSSATVPYNLYLRSSDRPRRVPAARVRSKPFIVLIMHVIEATAPIRRSV